MDKYESKDLQETLWYHQVLEREVKRQEKKAINKEV